jgi:mRNA-degrading endonuclease RelE of RelBE toxin-antitoxin system
MYEILISDRAKKQLKKLDSKTRNHVGGVIERIRIRPFAHVKAIVESPYYRARAGDYRIILDIKKGKLTIVVIEIMHRKKAYKR